MPLPGDLTTITVNATYPNGGGTPLTGTVTFTPSTDLTDATGHVIIRAAPITVPLSAGTISTPPLACTDNANLSPTGWYWIVTENIAGLPLRPYGVFLPHTLGSSVDLSDLVQVNPAPPVSTLYGVLAMSYTNTWLSTQIFDGPIQIPTGAGANKVLTSDTAGDATWQPIGVPLKSGWYYPQDGGGGTLTLVYNQLWVFPFDCQRAITLATLALNVKTAGSAGSVIRMGVWGSDGAGSIGNLIRDAGTVTGAATGVQALTALAQAAGPDRLWIGAVWQGTNNVAPQVQSYAKAGPYLGWSAYNQFPSVVGYQYPGIAGALPASLAAPTAFENNAVPGVQFAPA